MPADPFVDTLQAAEDSGIAGMDFDNYRFLEAIPENGGNAQAFVLYVPGNVQNPNSSPEPGGAVLLSIGLGLLGISKLCGLAREKAAVEVRCRQ